MMMSSLWAMNSAMAASAQSRTIGENFLLQMAPAIDRQVSIQIEWLQSTKEITARDFSEFRDKTLAIYQKQYPVHQPLLRSAVPVSFIRPWKRQGGGMAVVLAVWPLAVAMV